MTPEAAGRDSASSPRGVFPGFLEGGAAPLCTTESTRNLHWRYSSRVCLPAAPSSLDLPSHLPWELAVSSSAAEGLRKPKERMEEKKSPGLAKVFSCYQPLRASLSGVWEAGQAEPRSGMEPPPHIWDAGFELG